MENKTEEKWKDIEGYEGTHQVSNMGRVRYWDKRTKSWKFKHQQKRDGYCCVMLRHGKKRRVQRVHRLVAKAFIDNPENKGTVNHISMIKDCNCVKNLEWMTQKENNQAYEELKNQNNEEKWKDIEGYEGTHQVSNKGRVRYWDERTKSWKFKHQQKRDGYCCVMLPHGKKRRVHRLVAKAFVDNPENKEIVNHKNMIKDCNCMENLEWKTQRENNQKEE